MTKLEIGHKIETRDFAQRLIGQNGTFLVSKPGTQLVVVCQEGHSIRSIRSVGSEYPTVPLGGGPQDIWVVEKLNNAIEVIAMAEIADAPTPLLQPKAN